MKSETQKAVENFDLKEHKVRLELIYAMAKVKKASAMAMKDLQILSAEKAWAMEKACDRILDGEADERFVTQALQGGAGTSTHMNVNEVIAELAEENGVRLHPLDEVNKGQSTNDVYPTALRIAAIDLVRQLSDACAKLQESLQKKENEYADIRKLGRTELMDAMPITLGQEFGAYAQAIARDRWRIYKVEERLRQVNLGGTAVGTGSNASRKYTYRVVEILRDLTNMGLARAEYPMDLTQNNDVFVEVSGLLKSLAVSLMKISTDLRLMNSGPGGGFGEIHLQELQAGSTIMPGKVNPVIPEMMTQIAIKVMANDSAITMSAACGNFELNAFMPLIADSLLESLQLLVRGVTIFREKCIETLEPDLENCRKHLENSFVLATTLTPYIGYEKAAELVHSYGTHTEKIKAQIIEEGLMSEEQINQVFNYARESTYLK